MIVKRISVGALKKLLDGKVKVSTTCVVKFYSNKCHLCHALRDYYEEIAAVYPNILFFAFNTGTPDARQLKNTLKINGVPSIALIKTALAGKPKIHMLGEPQKPHEKTWYTSRDITDFIEEYK
tara:strand:+ start:9984 stop:10352 length:369 start_codon:yes stop_codon:yes gene_type:complete